MRRGREREGGAGEAARTAIVVLGAAVRPDGAPSAALARRIAHARALHAAGRGAVVIGAGGLGAWPPPEARVIAAALVAGGVPADAVLEEDRSHSTFENALFSIRLMRARGLKRALVVSDRYHLPRAVLTFRLLGMPASGSGPKSAPDLPWRAWLWQRAREAAALPVYLARGLAWRARRAARHRGGG